MSFHKRSFNLHIALRPISRLYARIERLTVISRNTIDENTGSRATVLGSDFGSNRFTSCAAVGKMFNCPVYQFFHL